MLEENRQVRLGMGRRERLKYLIELYITRWSKMVWDREAGLIWLAGLISTDGSITILRKKIKTGNYQYPAIRIASKELDWLEVVHDRLNEVGIRTSLQKRSGKQWGDKTVWTHGLYILKSRYIVAELYEVAKDFMNPRKLRIIENYLKWRKKRDEEFKQGNPTYVDWQGKWHDRFGRYSGGEKNKA